MYAIRLIALICAVVISIHTSTVGAENMPFDSIREDEFSNMKIINVLNYGAKGDGITDDTSAIQAAINAAKDYSQPGLLFFPTGKYLISSPLTIDRRISIMGTGIGSQIYQSADEHLFTMVPYAPGFISHLFVANLTLGSVATTSGKSLMYMSHVNRSRFDNIVMAGSHTGMYMEGCLLNTFVDIQSGFGSGFFGATSTNQYWVHMTHDALSKSNGNTFISPRLELDNWGFYIDSGGSQGNFNILGGVVEGGLDTKGIYVNGVTAPFTIKGVHLEGANAGIALLNCSMGEILDTLIGPRLDIQNCSNITVHNCSAGGISVDKNSSMVCIDELSYSGSLSMLASQSDMRSVKYVSNSYHMAAGIENRSLRNLVDGDLEAWSGGVPVGFSMWGTGAVITKETSIVKFGNSSAKVAIGSDPTHQNAALVYNVDYDKYAKLDPTNYRSSAYKWTASGNGSNEYYCESSDGGDPSIAAQPKGMLFNNSFATEGTIGSLNAEQWCYGDNDSLGYNTLYVRLPDDTDPDTKPSGYVEGVHKLYSLTVSAWAYKPEVNGVNPRITAYYNPGGSGLATQYAIATDEWTRISQTFVVRPSKSSMQILIGSGYFSGPPNGVCYLDGIEIVEGDSASPIYDDSRGFSGPLRVDGQISGSMVTGALKALTYATSIDVDMDEGNAFTLTTTGDCTVNASNGFAGQRVTFIITDDATGGHQVTFGTNFKSNGTLSGTANQAATVDFAYDGTSWYEVSRTTGL